MMEKRIATLDIDHTLAGGVVPAHMTLYNHRLNLGMLPQEISDTVNFPKTFDVPQIAKFRAQGVKAEKEFQRARDEIRTSELVHLSFNELPGSAEGVKNLLTMGSSVIFGGYYSVRPTEVEDTTKEWLKKNSFPHPDKVTICSSPQDKLTRIMKDYLEESVNGESVFLIDDGLKELVEAAKIIVNEDPKKRRTMERLVVVGFGQTESKRAELEGSFYPATGLRTLVLPSWKKDDVNNLIATLSSN